MLLEEPPRDLKILYQYLIYMSTILYKYIQNYHQTLTH